MQILSFFLGGGGETLQAHLYLQANDQYHL